MSQQIYFDFLSQDQHIQPMPYNPNITIAQIYLDVYQKLGHNDFFITLDQINRLSPYDNNTLGYYRFVPDTSLFIHNLLTLNVLFKLDDQTFNNYQLKDTLQIQQILQYFLSEIKLQQVMIENIEIFIKDQYGQQYPITCFDQQQQLWSLFQGQNQISFLAYQKNQKSDLPQKQIGEILLEQLIILENVSLIIDPTEKAVGYKFHFPQQISGYLTEEKGKPRDKIKSFNYVKCDWKDLQKIKYAQIINGFAICWENGSISFVQISIL